jgi:hypothetical protein
MVCTRYTPIDELGMLRKCFCLSAFHLTALYSGSKYYMSIHKHAW